MSELLKMPSMYKYLGLLYRGLRKKLKNPEFKDLREIVKQRIMKFRHSKESVIRTEKPIRIDKARMYGYKAKQGFVTCVCRVRKGGRNEERPSGGRKPTGYKKLTPAKSIQRIAEERAQRKFMNLEILHSYLLYEDGQYKYYEIIMVDPHHPVIKSDKDVNYLCRPEHKHRVFRGLTPAGKKARRGKRK